MGGWVSLSVTHSRHHFGDKLNYTPRKSLTQLNRFHTNVDRLLNKVISFPHQDWQNQTQLWFQRQPNKTKKIIWNLLTWCEGEVQVKGWCLLVPLYQALIWKLSWTWLHPSHRKLTTFSNPFSIESEKGNE